VQHLEFLSDEEKSVFKTAYELNMMEVVQQAGDRQQYICQAQSLNVFLRSPISGKYLSELHIKAHEVGVKSMYYLRSESVIEADKIDSSSVRRQVGAVANTNNFEECTMCQ